MSPDTRTPGDRGTPRRGWRLAAALAGPVMLLVVVGILVFSNTDSATVNWAAWQLDAPLYAVLLVTFAAGAAGWPLLVRTWRRRRAKEAVRRREGEEQQRFEAEVTKRLREEEERRRRDRGLGD